MNDLHGFHGSEGCAKCIQSGWTPPKTPLPTELTWGIVVNTTRLPSDGIRSIWNYLYLGEWIVNENGTQIGSASGHLFPTSEVDSFIPCTTEQVTAMRAFDRMRETGIL